MKPTPPSLWFVFVLLAALAPQAAADEPDLSQKLLGLTDEMRIQLDGATQQGLMEIAPVNLPVNPPGDCNHYGWPIATMVGDTIVVMHRRIPGHNPRGAGGPDEKMSYGIVLHSTDGGKTWSQPYDLRDCVKPEDRNRGGVVPLSHRFKFYSTADGFHPAGAVVDEKRGVQHIFVYAGHPNGPAGIFRITRTLDTPKLTTILKPDIPEMNP